MWKKLSFLQKNLIWSIPSIMVLGIIYGYFYNPTSLKALILPFTFLMVYPMMVTLQMKKVLSKGDMKLQVVTQVINFAIIPFVAYFIGTIFFKESPLIALGLLMAALLPTSGMTISWTGFAKGNLNAAIKMTIIGLIAGSIAAPVYAKWLMGTVIEIPLVGIFRQIALVVFLPMLAGYATQRILIRVLGEAKYHKDIKKKFPMLSTLGVLGIVFVAMAIKSKTIIGEPSMLLYLFVPLVILYGINFTLSTIVGKLFFNRGDGIALVYGTVMRNLSIALAISMTVFGEKGSDIALIIAMAYIIQVQAAAWYVRFTDTIFGTAPADIVQDVMATGVFSLDENASLHDAIRLLDEEMIHSVAVLSKDDKPSGIITAENIINLIAGNTPLDKKLGNLKLAPPLTCRQDTPLKEVIGNMKRKHEYRILVTDSNGALKGIVTESDILDTFSAPAKNTKRTKNQ